MADRVITTPFTKEKVPEFFVEEGLTIHEVLVQAEIPFAVWGCVVIKINGQTINRIHWSEFTLKENQKLAILVRPMGSDSSKDMLRMVAMLVVAAAAAWATAGAGGAFLAGSWQATALGFGISVVGALAISALIPPPKLEDSSGKNDSYYITSQQNRLRPYELIPIVYGWHKMIANLATAPVILNAGASSLFSGLYDFGLGGVTLSNIRAGQNTLDNFNAETRILERVPQVRRGNGLWDPIDLQLVNFPVHYEDLQVDLVDSGNTVTAATADNSMSALLEISFPAGLVKITQKGNEKERSVTFFAWFRAFGQVQKSPLPAGWSIIAGDHLWHGEFPGGGGGGGGIADPGAPVRPKSYAPELRVDLSTNYDVVCSTDIAEVTAHFDQAVGITAAAFRFYDADSGIELSPNKVKVDTTPANPESRTVAADGLMTINAGYDYKVELTFAAGFTGRIYAVVDSSDLMVQNTSTPFPKRINRGAFMVVDQNAAATFSPDLPYIRRFNDTKDHETYIMQREYREVGKGEWRPVPSGAVMMVDGRSEPVRVRDVPSLRGEYIRSESHGQVVNKEYRNSFFALSVAPGYYDNKDGKVVQYMPDPLTTTTRFTISGDEARAGVVSLYVPFPQEGKYEIIIQRTTAKPSGSNEVDHATATKIISRGYSMENNPYAILNLQKQHTLMEVQFEAASNIQGNVQEISALVAQKVRIHDGERWVRSEETSNPAWIVADILTGWSIQNHETPPAPYGSLLFDGGWIRDDQIDWDSFIRFAQVCDETVEYTDAYDVTRTRKRYAFNGIINSDDPIITTCQEILAMARAQLILSQEGKIAVMLDEERTTPRQVFTPRNSWGFKGSRTFTQIPDAFNVQFTAPELDYHKGTITVYRPGKDKYTAETFEDLDTIGITNWHQAAWYGMFMLAQGVVRNETFELNCDAESLAVQRGDLVYVQHDVPLLGGQTHFIRNINFDSAFRIYLDQAVGIFSEPMGYTLRQKNGDIAQGTVSAHGEDWIELDRFHNAAAGDLIVIGTIKENGGVTDPYLVTEITPGQDFNALIKLVRYDEDVYRTDYGSFPIWNPSFDGSAPEAAELEVLGLTGRSSVISGKLTYYHRVKLFWSIRGDTTRLGGYRISFFPNGEVGRGREVAFIEGDATRWTGEFDKRHAEFGNGMWQVTPVSQLGFEGIADNVYLSPLGDIIAPAAPTGAAATQVTGAPVLLSWNANTESDLAGYRIYGAVLGGNFASASFIMEVDGYTTSAQLLKLNAKTKLLFLTAFDFADNESAASKAVTLK